MTPLMPMFPYLLLRVLLLVRFSLSLESVKLLPEGCQLLLQAHLWFAASQGGLHKL